MRSISIGKTILGFMAEDGLVLIGRKADDQSAGGVKLFSLQHNLNPSSNFPMQYVNQPPFNALFQGANEVCSDAVYMGFNQTGGYQINTIDEQCNIEVNSRICIGEKCTEVMEICDRIMNSNSFNFEEAKFYGVYALSRIFGWAEITAVNIDVWFLTKRDNCTVISMLELHEKQSLIDTARRRMSEPIPYIS